MNALNQDTTPIVESNAPAFLPNTEWVIFGDDWGAHPSTSQHIVKELARRYPVTWINSIGMRTPELSKADFERALTKLRRRPASNERTESVVTTEPADSAPRVIEPRILPMHGQWVARELNRVMLRKQVGPRARNMRRVVLSANPVAVEYIDALQPDFVVYLRLDDYEHLPGVDPELVRECEPRMFRRADLVCGTAEHLIPDELPALRTLYTPQGVDWNHFEVDHQPGETRTVGFFGLLAEWVDAELVAEVARRRPDVTFEFLGPRRVTPEAFESLPNIRLVDAVAYADLPDAIRHWDAAWIPFEVSELTDRVNPLKLREYLAAGLATASTPMPEVVKSGTPATIISSVDDALAWVDDALAHATHSDREARRQSVKSHSWTARAQSIEERIRL